MGIIAHAIEPMIVATDPPSAPPSPVIQQMGTHTCTQIKFSLHSNIE